MAARATIGALVRVVWMSVLIAPFVAPPVAAQQVLATAVTVSGERTRLIARLSQPVEEVVRADGRDGLIIDLPGARWRSSPPTPRGLIERVRVEAGRSSGTRLTVALDKPAQVVSTHWQKVPGSSAVRLIVELAPAPAERRETSPSTARASNGRTEAETPPRAHRAAAPQIPAATSPPSPHQAASPPLAAASPPVPLLRGPEPATQRLPAASVSPPSPHWAVGPPPTAPTPPVMAPSPAQRPQRAGREVVVAIPAAAPRPPPRDNRLVIALDAGHGGVDPGAISAVTGVYEKTITLAVARDVRRELEASGRFRVVMTRDSDVFIRLRDRVQIARTAGADLFVSIHADSLQGDQRVSGLSVYTLSEQASDREAEALAQRENRVDSIGGADLRGAGDEVLSILIDLAQRETQNASARFAQTLVRQMRAADIPTLPQPHRFAGLAVLTAPDVPSVLVELGYLSNRDDARRLANPEQRQRLARGIASSIERFFDPTTAVARR